MSRKKCAGGAISFRLPLEADKAFREKAKAEGVTPGQYARKQLLTYIQSGL